MTSSDRHISIDQRVGGWFQSESDPATCFVGDMGTFPSVIRKMSKRDVDLAEESTDSNNFSIGTVK